MNDCFQIGEMCLRCQHCCLIGDAHLCVVFLWCPHRLVISAVEVCHRSAMRVVNENVSVKRQVSAESLCVCYFHQHQHDVLAIQAIRYIWR